MSPNSWSVFLHEFWQKHRLPRVTAPHNDWLSGIDYPTFKSLCYLVNTKDINHKLHLRSREKVIAEIYIAWKAKWNSPTLLRPGLQSKPIAQKGLSSAYQPGLLSASFLSPLEFLFALAPHAHQAGLSNLLAFFTGPFWYLWFRVTSLHPLPANCVLNISLLSELRHFFELLLDFEFTGGKTQDRLLDLGPQLTPDFSLKCQCLGFSWTGKENLK